MQFGIVHFLSIISYLGTWLPILNLSNHWSIRGQEYLKNFYLITNLIFAFILILIADHFFDYIFIAGAIISAIHCVAVIYPFTVFYKKTVPDCHPNGSVLHLFIYNVYQFNEQYQAVSAKIKEMDPDIIFLVETDELWEKGLDSVLSDYPYVIQDVKDDTYGLILRSKIPFQKAELHYFILDSIPSVEVRFQLNDHEVTIFGLHPKPPAPGEATYATSKDKEIITVARIIEEMDHDANILVVGDMNDVAWSRASHKFKKITGMKDPREGRVFYATFPSYFPIKIPLDHIYCSKNFELVSFEVLSAMGSDHHAVSVKFSLVD